MPVDGLAEELQLVDGRGRVADEVHPGAVPAVLRAGRQQLGQHLGRVAVGEALGRPHVVLVEGVAAGVGVRGPVGTAVGEHRDHVVPHRVGVERVGQRARTAGRLVGRHRVHHLRRHQHRHGGPLGLVALEVGVEALVDEVAEQLAQLADVLHAVRALPLGALPLLAGDVLPPGEAGPVGLDELDPAVGIGLPGLVPRRWQAIDVSMLMALWEHEVCGRIKHITVRFTLDRGSCTEASTGRRHPWDA